VTAGAKSFIFESKLNRQTVRVTIGDVRAWTLGAARDEARRLQTMIDQGIDPRQEKRDRIAAAEAKIEEAKRIATPAMEAWQAYLAARAPVGVERTLLDHQRLVDAWRATQDPRPPARRRRHDASRASFCRCWPFLWNRSTPTACAPG
jgi:hypothetical protein